MSDFGLMVWNSTNEVIFDSRNAQGGVCVGAVEVSPGATTTLTYPQYAGRSARVLQTSAAGNLVSVSYTSGYPAVTLTVPLTYVNPAYFVIFLY